MKSSQSINAAYLPCYLSHMQTHKKHTLWPNVSSGCRVDGVLCSECSDSEWRSQKAHVEVESSTSSLKWPAFMLHIVPEPKERGQHKSLKQKKQNKTKNYFKSACVSQTETSLPVLIITVLQVVPYSKWDICFVSFYSYTLAIAARVDAVCQSSSFIEHDPCLGLLHSLFRSGYMSGHKSNHETVHREV